MTHFGLSRRSALALLAAFGASFAISGRARGAGQSAVWHPAGPAGASIQSLSPDPASPTGLFAGSSSAGLFHSPDAGVSWSLVGGLGDLSILTVAIGPGTPAVIYAGSTDTLSRSLDGGVVWTPLFDSSTVGGVVAFLAPDDGVGPLLAGTGSGGLLGSADDGVTWPPITQGFTAATVHSLAPGPGAAGLRFAGTDAGVFISADGGVSWVLSTTGPAGPVFVVSGIGGAAFAGAPDGLYRSADAGQTWQILGGGLPAGAVRALVNDVAGGVIEVGTDAGVFESADFGDTWVPTGTGLEGTPIAALSQAGDGRLFAASQAGALFRLDLTTPRMAIEPVSRAVAPRLLPPRP